MAANYPEPVDHCDVCRWRKPCDDRRHADDHLSLVAGITRLNRREFEANDVKTLERLGDLVLPIPFKPAKCSKESLEKAQGQARVQLAGRRAHAPIHELLPVEEGRGLARLPEPSPGDVFLDLEGDHFAAEGPREYLFGMTILGPAGKTRHVSSLGRRRRPRRRPSSRDPRRNLRGSGKPTRACTSTTTRPTSPPRSRGSWAGTPRAPASSTACCAPSCSSTSWPSSSRASGPASSRTPSRSSRSSTASRARPTCATRAPPAGPSSSLSRRATSPSSPPRSNASSPSTTRKTASRPCACATGSKPCGPTSPGRRARTATRAEEQEQRSKDVQDAMDALLKGVPDEQDRAHDRAARPLAPRPHARVPPPRRQGHVVGVLPAARPHRRRRPPRRAQGRSRD